MRMGMSQRSGRDFPLKVVVLSDHASKQSPKEFQLAHFTWRKRTKQLDHCLFCWKEMASYGRPCWAGMMAQWVRVLAGPDNLSSVPRTHVV